MSWGTHKTAAWECHRLIYTRPTAQSRTWGFSYPGKLIDEERVTAITPSLGHKYLLLFQPVEHATCSHVEISTTNSTAKQ
jgi:hypothetical protein